MKTTPCAFRQAAALFLAVAVLCSCFHIAQAAQYRTLEFGSRGSEVLKLQKTLLSLGFDPNGTDGKFGRGTENAVMDYQKSKGLTSDGKAGALTLSALYADAASGSSGSSGSGSSESGSSGSTGTATNPNTLKYGDSGSRVTDLQTKLVALGYNTNGVDGRFGAGTQKAVIAFQRANGLKADGLAGSQTLSLLDSKAGSAGNSSGSGSSDSGSSGSGSSSGSFSRTLRNGATGSDVKQVQTQLQTLGYYGGKLDGVYGSGSMAAVAAFQKANGLKADGLAGSQTFAKLFSSSAVAVGGGSGSSGSGSDSSGSDSGSSGSGSGSSGAYITLREGSTGTEVKALQQALKNLNYNVSPDGTYGGLTKMAVIAFQKRNGLTADGVAGAETQAKLFSGSALPADSSDSGGSGGGSGNTDPGGQASGPSTGSVKLLHWFNEVKPSIRTGQTIVIFDPATSLQWNLRLYSLGHHADSEPITKQDTQIMYKAFGYTNTWTPKPVYVKLPNGNWTLATMHNVPHLSGSIQNNDFDGHLCVHFLRDMEECRQNDPNYGVQNQNAIRKKWKQMTGQDIP